MISEQPKLDTFSVRRSAYYSLVRFLYHELAIPGKPPELGATRNVSAYRQKNVSRVKVGKTPTSLLHYPSPHYDCAGTSLDRPKGISVRNPFGLPWPDRHPNYVVILVLVPAAVLPYFYGDWDRIFPFKVFSEEEQSLRVEDGRGN